MKEHAPPGAVALGHGFGQDPDVEHHGHALYGLGLLESCVQLLERTDGICFATVALGDLGEIHRHEGAGVLPVLAPETELGAWTAVKSSEWSMMKLPSPTMAYTSRSPMAYLTPKAPETS